MDYVSCKVKLLTPTAKMPQYNSEDQFAIGADGYADLKHDGAVTVIPKGERALISLGIAIEPMDNMIATKNPVLRAIAISNGYVRLAPRSGLSVKGIDIGAGVIDVSYRGEVKAVVINNSKSDYVLKHHDKICQLIFERAQRMMFETVSELGESQRGEKGFGSSG